MTCTFRPARLAAAHAHGRAAARWLQVAGYRPQEGYWPVGTLHPAWHVLVDPDTPAGEWLWAVRSLLDTLEDDVAVERHATAKVRARTDHRVEWDPQGAMWRTTLRGAALQTAQDLLFEAARILTELGVEQQGPSPERYVLVANFGRAPARVIRAR